MNHVDFYYAIGSRYSYLAASQIDRLQSETGCQIEWHRLNSVRLLATREADPFSGTPISGQYEWSYRTRDAARWADFYRIPFVEPRGRVEFDPEVLARACTAAKLLGSVEMFSRSLFEAMFGATVTRIDEAECVCRALGEQAV